MKKFVAIESLRGWLAWWVVAAHALAVSGMGHYLPHAMTKILGQANMAVQIFMIVSGFVIAHVLMRKQEPYQVYVVRRACRLMPLFLVTLIVAIIISDGFDLYRVAWVDNVFASGATERIAKMASEHQYWGFHLLAHLTMLHGTIPDSVLPFAATSFLAPAWSLSLEWQFYLVAPLMITAMASRKFSSLLVLMLIGSWISLTGKLGSWGQDPSFLLLALPFFLIGIVSRYWLEGKSKVPLPTLLVTLASIGIFGISTGAKSTLFLLPVAGIWGVFLAITALETGRIVWKPNRVGRALLHLIAYNPVIVNLGRVSYSTYLAHIPLMSIVIGIGLLCNPAADRTTVALLTVLSVILTVPVSFVLYYLVELPGQRWSTEMLRRRRSDTSKNYTTSDL